MLQKRKNVLMWGPLFVGALVRPNMLTMPKSASEGSPYVLPVCTLTTRHANAM